MKTTTITRELNLVHLGQTVAYVETLKADGYTLRVHIESDAYRMQCFAHIDVMTPANGWTRVHDLLRMNTEPALYTAFGLGRLDESAFQRDRDTLVDAAVRILHGV